MKKCYLAGPMRGYPEFNFPAFFAAAKSLRERGYEVWSPAENDIHQDGFNPATDAAQPMRHYMKRDLPAVLDADFVAVLPGWENSAGAKCEVYVARACGITVLNAADLSEALAARPEAMAQMTEERARKILDTDLQPDGRIYNGGHYVSWAPGEQTACLDDNFTADELEAIAFFMRRAMNSGGDS